MFEYQADPNHPDAHPLYDDSNVKKPVYDPKDLSLEQIAFEERRARRKACKKQKRLAAEAEELERNGGKVEKVHKRYAPKNALITEHDFDGIPEHCTECTAPLWGTEFVLPLWKKSLNRHPFLIDPFCEGCYRLFDTKWCKSLSQRHEVILWILTGEAENLNDDIELRKKLYEKNSISMRERATRMIRATALFDHPSWTFLKSKAELSYEYQHAYPDMSIEGIRSKVDNFLAEDPDVKRVPPKPIYQVEIASGAQLRQLALAREGRDALLGHKCFVRFGNTYNGLTFDHLEPCSQIRYVDGTYSIGNLQILSRCINKVKGHYPEREVVRWLIRVLECYETRYGEDQRRPSK